MGGVGVVGRGGGVRGGGLGKVMVWEGSRLGAVILDFSFSFTFSYLFVHGHRCRMYVWMFSAQLM